MKEPEAYCAFISYTHKPLDERWAKWLVREIERYNLPKDLVADGYPKKLGKCYRDKDEFSAEPELRTVIEDALTNSATMIVVCSRDTPKANWVNNEIRMFRTIGNGQRVLALLVDGEPSDAFPDALTVNKDGKPIEPAAVDVRNLKYRGRKTLKHDAKLRVVSGIIGCKFDQLKKRDKLARQKKQRFNLAVGTILGAVLVWIISIIYIDGKNKAADLSSVSIGQEAAALSSIDHLQLKAVKVASLAVSVAHSDEAKSNARQNLQQISKERILLSHTNYTLKNPPQATNEVLFSDGTSAVLNDGKIFYQNSDNSKYVQLLSRSSENMTLHHAEITPDQVLFAFGEEEILSWSKQGIENGMIHASNERPHPRLKFAKLTADKSMLITHDANNMYAWKVKGEALDLHSMVAFYSIQSAIPIDNLHVFAYGGTTNKESARIWNVNAGYEFYRHKGIQGGRWLDYNDLFITWDTTNWKVWRKGQSDTPLLSVEEPDVITDAFLRPSIEEGLEFHLVTHNDQLVERVWNVQKIFGNNSPQISLELQCSRNNGEELIFSQVDSHNIPTLRKFIGRNLCEK